MDGSNGGLATNYSINTGQTTTANISKKMLTVSGITASNKSYDGTTSVTLDTSSVSYNGLVSGDSFAGNFSGVFANENIGTGRIVNITSVIVVMILEIIVLQTKTHILLILQLAIQQLVA